jgi:N-carbamoylputrescine amidase
MPRQIRIAGVQVSSDNGEIEENLARAEGLVAEAASRGAELVLCPEFLAPGYVFDESIWKYGERRGGPTEAWLSRVAKKHAITIGASYLESDGADFANTFTLAGPDGSILGRVRKESLPAFEGWYFKSCEEPKTIATPIGRLGVGICQDNHTARFFKRMMRDAPDLLLMPHSAPCVPLAGPAMRDQITEIGPYYARQFGIPTILVNKAVTRSLTPIPGVPLVRVPFAFPGLSTITDSDGIVRDQLVGREGIVIADVMLDPSRKRTPDAPRGYWSRPPRLFPRVAGLFFVAFEELGKRAYLKSDARRRAAQST